LLCETIKALKQNNKQINGKKMTRGSKKIFLNPLHKYMKF